MTLRPIVLNTLFVLGFAGLAGLAGLAGCGSEKSLPTAAPAAGGASLAQPPKDQLSPVSEPVAQPRSRDVAAGTLIPLRLLSVIDSSIPFEGFALGAVETDVRGADGQVAIPAGSHAAIAVRDAGKSGAISTVRLGLYSLNVAGHQYPLSNGVKDPATLVLTEDAGRGSTHSTVHMQYGSHIEFRLDRPIQLR